MHNEKGEYNDNDDEKEYGSNKKTCKWLIFKNMSIDISLLLLPSRLMRSVVSKKVEKEFFF